MITARNNVFHLATRNTSYVFLISARGVAEHLLYGHRLRSPEREAEALRVKRLAPRPGEVSMSERDWEVNLNDTGLEFSTEGLGDFRTPFLSIEPARNCAMSLDLRYRSSELFKGMRRGESGIPQAIGTENDCTGCRLDFQDDNAKITLSVYYTVFQDSDVITRRAVIKNNSKQPVRLKSAYSLQLDLPTSDMDLVLTGGPWGREMRATRRPLAPGAIVNESRNGFTGASSNTISLDCPRGRWTCGLLWSGDHREVVEVTPYGRTHVLVGENPDTSTSVLQPGEAHETPEAFMTWAPDAAQAAANLHSFVRNHVERGTWRGRLRPVAYNTRLSLGLDVTENRLLDEIKLAGELGFELFTLDDGWFGARSDKSTSLGDWSANTGKLPSGLAAISKAARRAGMLFGLWVAPEMASIRSRYAIEHPDWLVRDPRKKDNPGEGSQYLIDLTREEVFEDVHATLRDLIERSGVDHIRWELGCQEAEVWSKGDDQLDWRRRYVVAFSRLQRSIQLAFPNLLIENVSSSAPRFDLGLLTTSSMLAPAAMTDPFEMLDSITGAIASVPPSCLSNTVAERKWNIEGRFSSFSSAFNIALFGCLSYSVDLKRMSVGERAAIRDQIAFYKLHREVCQFGAPEVVENGERVVLTVASPDRSTILCLLALRRMRPNAGEAPLRMPCALEYAVYRVSRRPEEREVTSADDYFTPPPLEEEAHIVSGDTLKWVGVTLAEPYLGGAYTEEMRVMGDHSTRLYVAKRIDRAPETSTKGNN